MKSSDSYSQGFIRLGLTLAALGIIVWYSSSLWPSFRQEAVTLGMEHSGAVLDSHVPNDRESRFVQEPLQRSSFRPDLTRGLTLSNHRNNLFVLRAFRTALRDAWKATVRISAGGDQVALGAVVHPDGWVVTKASQIPPETTIYCEIYTGKSLIGEVVATDRDDDLALLRVNATGLPFVRWSESVPARGAWVATTDTIETPRSVGVVSTGPVQIEESTAVLGVTLTETVDGAAIVHVLPGTGADAAGLRMGDTIFEVNGKPVNGLRSFRRAIADLRGGDRVRLRFLRGEKELEVTARLMDLTDELLDDTEMEVNGRISARATGFEQVFMHDTVLDPNDCGGPLVNLEGEVVGINIARAGRVTSYALPASIVQTKVDAMMRHASLVSQEQPADAGVH